jgi:hypothetical protein
MVQRGERASLALEAGQAILLACDGFRNDLDGNISTELQVTSAIDFAHPALADWGDNLVPTEPSARGERHGEALRL